MKFSSTRNGLIYVALIGCLASPNNVRAMQVTELEQDYNVETETESVSEVGKIGTMGVFFVEKEVLSQEELEMLRKSQYVPPGCKSANITWMAYQAVTCKSSAQYKLLNGDTAYTDEETGLRMVDGCYCAAIGTGWGCKIGQKFDVYMNNGNVFHCIMGDAKADIHTDEATHKFQAFDGSVLEMIRDSNCDMKYPEGLSGGIERIVVLD